MNEFLPIPYLDTRSEVTWRCLDPETRQRLIAAARDVLDGAGYRKAAAKHKVEEVGELLRAIVRPVKSREHPPPWEAPVLEPTSTQALMPPVNMLPTLDFAEEHVDGAKALAEYVQDGRLTPMQASAVMLLALGESGVQIANRLQVLRSTVSDWRRLPIFREAYGLVVRERAEALMAKLDEAQTLALATLIEALRATTTDKVGNVSPDWDIRLRAAKELLDRGGRLLKTNRMVVAAETGRDDLSIEERLAQIAEQERALEAELTAVGQPLQVIEGGRGS